MSEITFCNLRGYDLRLHELSGKGVDQEAGIFMTSAGSPDAREKNSNTILKIKAKESKSYAPGVDISENNSRVSISWFKSNNVRKWESVM